MRFKTIDTIGDPPDDLELASDIISQEESSTGYGGSRMPKTDDNEISAGPEWSDPWSSEPWKNSWGDTTNTSQSRIETSFESLAFKPVLKTAGEDSDLLDFNDAFGAPFGPTDISSPNVSMISASSLSSRQVIQSTPSPKRNKAVKVNVGVVVKERLSIFFDETTNDPSCKVVGRIYVKPTKRRLSSFSLTIRDSRAHIEHWDERNSRCQNITAAVPHLALDSNDQVFSISLTKEHRHDLGLDAPVVSYTCISKLRPMPLLLKTKTHQKSDRCRLGVRIRANPQNTYVLRDFVILIIVPLGLDGESVTMSRRGGVWNDMKRSLVWNITKLDPGEIIDIQAQFKSNMEEGPGEDNLGYFKFPVLARCYGDTNFSKIDLNTDYNEDGSCPVGMELEHSATILYRKI